MSRYNIYDCARKNHPEVTDINKQKFLAELGKLLTFMYEEDRQLALSRYEDMFERCKDEQQLIHQLISPTRQAVVLARAYDAKERMLSVHTQSRREELYEDMDGEKPGFVSVIDSIEEKAEHLFSSAAAVSAEQFSLFAQEESVPAVPVAQTQQMSPCTDTEAECVQEPIEDSVRPSESAVLYAPSEEAGEYLTAGASIELDESVFERHEIQRQRSEVQYRRSVPLLILYIIFALPISILGVALLLVPTVLFLALSFVCAAVGLTALNCAFGSFAIFADILVVLGTGLILMALGLLFLWFFIWFIGGAIAGFINGIIKLGNSFSSREVSAE